MLPAARLTPQKIAAHLEQLAALIYPRRHLLAPFRYRRLPDASAVPPLAPDLDDRDWEIIAPPAYWGEWQADFVLHGGFQAPPGWDPAAPTALYLPLGEAADFSHPEALVYVDGRPLAGCDRHHQEIELPPGLCDGRAHSLALHGWTGMQRWNGSEPGTRPFMRPCALVQIDPPTRQLLAAARTALEAANLLEESSLARVRLLEALDRLFQRLDLSQAGCPEFYAALPAALAELRAGLAQAGPAQDAVVWAAGQAHIDVAWLWTLDQTRRKVGRTFHTVLRLMERFPNFTFTQSQPQLYEFVRQDYPELFAAIRRRVAEGRWEATGGMWVEADCNLCGGEALARQFLLGRAFYREHFGPGADTPVLWLPDTFGFCWSLPQLMRQAGMPYFTTIKLGWNQYNRLPYDSFWWQGLDGSRVLAHFAGKRECNLYLSPEAVMSAWQQYQPKEAYPGLLALYGYGDGGGGPTPAMLENLDEMAALPGLPRVQPGRAVDFFQDLETSAGERLPVWDGELYLETHRGVYTTQARLKRANRQSEFALHDAEFLASTAAVLAPGYAYPATALRQAWQTVCLNGFHDILPGSSIPAVNAQALDQYEAVLATAQGVCAAALEALSARLGGDLLVANPTSFWRRDLAFWPGQLPPGMGLCRPGGEPVWTQPAEGGLWLAPGDLPPYSLTPLILCPAAPPPAGGELRATPTCLENSFLRVELDAAGDITRIYDRRQRRELLPPGAIANQFLAFEDRPLESDAWNIDLFYEDRCWPAAAAEAVRVVECGPLRAALEIRRRVRSSLVVQRIVLALDSPCLTFETHVDWREQHTLLKVAFPVAVLAPAATYEIPWGSIARPTHRNTSWDWARFEVCAQKWADLSEGGYGVSLLNDCKYGYDVHANVLRLTLLRSPTEPDPDADQGEHRFTYSLLPHAGGWEDGTPAAAYALNDPPRVHAAAPAAEPASCGPLTFIQCEPPGVIVETLKQAEDGQGLIVRLYESRRSRGPVTLTTTLPIAQAWRCDLLEQDQPAGADPLEIDGRCLRFNILPFEIVTLRLAFAANGLA